MKFDLPMSEDARTKKGKRLSRFCTIYNVLTVGCAVLALLLLLGVLAAIIASEFKRDAATLCYILAGDFGGGSVLFGVATVILSRASAKLDAATLDYFERCDGEESFFLGEGTLGTFGEKGLTVHGPKRSVHIPYSDLILYSVCTRRRPCERGDYTVVFSIPAHYLTKADMDAPDLLIETAEKPRLLAAIEAHGLTLLCKKEDRGSKNTRYALEKKFYLPNKKKRKSAIAFMVFGGVLLAAGVAVVFFQTAVGAALVAFGIIVLGRAIYALLQARALFAVYREGIFWRESDFSTHGGAFRIFLKWEEIERITCGEQDGYPVLKVELPYGNYNLPRAVGAFEYLQEHHAEELSCGS